MDEAVIEYLEELMDMRKMVSLRFKGDNGGMANVQAKITELELNGSEPALWADGGLRIPLHRLIWVNDRPVQPLI